MNFDTLLEEAYGATSDRQQDVHPLYSNRDPLSHLQPNEVPLYKLHGCLSRSNSDEGHLVLTQEDFITVQDSRRRLFNRLMEDVSDFHVFYVGFRREDPDFTRILLEVEQAAKGLTGLRRSFALQPGYTEPEARRWEKKLVTLIDAKAGEAFAELEQQLPEGSRYVPKDQREPEPPPLLERKPKISIVVLEDVSRNFEVLDERLLEQRPNAEEFFLGASPNWGTIASDVDATRRIQDEILTSVLHDAHMDRRGVQMVVVHSEAGTGKSTLLMRIAYELAFTWNRVVVILKPYHDLDLVALESLSRVAEERVYLLVDDASSRAAELSALLSNAKRLGTKLTVLAAARTNEWQDAQEGHPFPGLEECELGPLDRAEIESVLDTLAKNESLGMLAGASREVQIAAFEGKADKQLLVALREATAGKAFDEIVVDEFDSIPSIDGQRAYLLVCSLHSLGIFTRAGLLHRAISVPLGEIGSRVLAPTQKIIISRDIPEDGDHYYSSRHPLIASIVADRKIKSENQKLMFYKDLLYSLDLGYASDAEAYRRLTRGQNRQLLQAFSNPAHRRELMEALIQLNPTDPFVHQHAAIMEMHERNLSAASNHLARALQLRSNDPAIQDTEGRLALAYAVVEQNRSRADDLFHRTIKLFERNIQRRRSEPFGYRHLAETYVEWSRRQGSEEERLNYLGTAYQVLMDGLMHCSAVSMLLQYQAELEQEFGDPDRARKLFGKALNEKPGNLPARFMAARLEERLGEPRAALALLEAGLSSSMHDPELHHRLAVLMAMVQPDRDIDIRGHFQAALLGPQRNYQPRLAYAAYLFSKGDFNGAADQFIRLEELPIPRREKYAARKFHFGDLDHHQAGRVQSVDYDDGWIEYGQGAVSIYFSKSDLDLDTRRSIRVGCSVTFCLMFNTKGPIAVRVHRA